MTRFTTFALLIFASPLLAQSLRNTIDVEVKAAWKAQSVTPAKPATDSEFLRRIYIDLVGTVPTYEETVKFLDDKDPKKREKLIDQLLADPRFGTAQANVWDQVMFGRHPGNSEAVRNRTSFKTWLEKQIGDNTPYNVWVKDILQAEKPGSELFYVQFRNTPEEATVQISRIFLGTQLQCAKCHDHPYDKWTQKDFYGMTGFFVRLVVQESGGTANKLFTIGEKGTGEVLFSGNAKDQAPGKKGEPIRPKFLGEKDLDEPASPVSTTKEPTLKAGEKLPKPSFSRKEKLAEWMTKPENPFFARAAVNRVFAQFMGRGIVHPIDDFQEQRPPTLPKLLEALTNEFKNHKYDLKWLIREIVNSDTYQIGLGNISKDALPKWFERAKVRPLSAEEIVTVMKQVNKFDVNVKLNNSGEEYFLRTFGEPTNGLGDFQGSLHEHLFMNNGEHVRAIFRRKKGNLADDLLASTEPWPKRIDRLYLSMLQRLPNDKERAEFEKFIAEAGAKPEGRVEDAIWVLMNSSEFRFNH